MTDYEPVVFISYAWGEDTDEREAIVNELDQSLQRRRLKIIRDKRDLGYKGSIRNFMTRIGEGDCVIVVISDKYLRSKNCMFELVEIAANKNFADRIFPIILEDAKIYNAEDLVEYVAYWEKKKAELNQKVETLQYKANAISILEEVRDYDRFHDEIDGLASTLKDMNCLTPEILREADFQQLYNALTERMKKTFSSASVRGEIPSPRKERKSMDPITLATAATTLLAPYISKVGEKALEKIGEQLPEKIGAVWQAISNRFQTSSSAVEVSGYFANDANDPDNQEDFARQLRRILKEDETFAGQLTELIEEAKSAAGINNVGDGVVATNKSIGTAFKTNGNISGSTINISSNIQSNDSSASSIK